MMDLRAEFAGTIYLPDKRFVTPGSPVYLPDGHLIALIAWRTWSGRFSILDPSGNTIASCRPRGVFRRSYTVLDAHGLVVLDVLPGAWRPLGGMEVTLGSGRRITVRRSRIWSARRFEFYDANNRLAGLIARGHTALGRLPGPHTVDPLVLRISIDIGRALGAAHQAHLVHRDGL